ncbi:MAG: hypothetical protein PVF34_00785 [Gammaproteobacteria bacterium]
MNLDPFGVIGLGLIFLAVMVAKWWYISPPEGDNCVICVVAVIWFVSMLVFSLLSVFWVLWSKKYAKGAAFLFFLCLLCLVLVVIDYEVVQFVVRKLFYGGALRWQEADASFLIDTFIPHSLGLLLISAIFYSSLRVFLCQELTEKTLVYTMNAIIMLAVLPLFYLGLWLY